MAPLFFFGTLCHAPLLRRVLGSVDHLTITPGVLPGYRAWWAKEYAFPFLASDDAAEAVGVLVEGLRPDDVARLDYYEGGFDYALAPVTVQADGRAVAAQVYFAPYGAWERGAPWLLADWQVAWGDVTVAAAGAYMAGLGRRSAAEAARFYPQMLQRAASSLRARATPAPVAIRSGLAAAEVRVQDDRRPYSEFFEVAEQDLQFPRFRGGLGATVTRAAFVSGDAVTVLPYDPVHDRVLLVEQFRFGQHMRGDPHPWCLEPIAGRIDAGETSERAARREAQEEAGLALGDLLPVAEYYPSPGAMTEYLYNYVALVDLPEAAAGLGGLDSEDEDIRSHVISFDQLMAAIAAGEVQNGPLILTAFWLAARRDAIRADA